jgi:hypothetical protein
LAGQRQGRGVLPLVAKAAGEVWALAAVQAWGAGLGGEAEGLQQQLLPLLLPLLLPFQGPGCSAGNKCE